MLRILTSVAILIGFIAHPVKSQFMDLPYSFVEEMPTFKGGMEAMYKFIADHLVYPDSARINGIEGKVFAQFVVDIDSLAKEVKIVRGIGGGCDEEVLRIFELMNAQKSWIPGRHENKPVPVKFTLPFKFELKNDVENKSTMPVPGKDIP